MSGHSKWSTIKHKKAKVDAQKGATFAKYSREITMAAKAGGANPDGNFRLRTAIEKSKAAGLPNDNIKRAIEKASSGGGADSIEEVTYEGYGPDGVAIIVETATDNRNRTAGDIRSYFNKNNGNLGETGCVSWMFKVEGIISIDKNNIDQDKLFEQAIEAGADDFLADDEEDYQIITTPESLQTIAEQIEALGHKVKNVEVTRTPVNTITIENQESARYLLRLLENLENHDDVQNVYANFDMDDSLIEE